MLCLLHSLSTGLISGFICAMYRIPHLPEWRAQPQEEQSRSQLLETSGTGGCFWQQLFEASCVHSHRACSVGYP